VLLRYIEEILVLIWSQFSGSYINFTLSLETYSPEHSKASLSPLRQQLFNLDSSISQNMASPDNKTILRVLTPYMCGAHSLRHFVVLRRATAHFLELMEFIQELGASAPPG
jgi:hypothetical protein